MFHSISLFDNLVFRQDCLCSLLVQKELAQYSKYLYLINYLRLKVTWNWRIIIAGALICRRQFSQTIMGRLSDKYGSRGIATLGVFFLAIATLVYLTLTTTSPLYIVLIVSSISGLGTSMFFPTNKSAVMANAQTCGYGSISGLLRTVQNIGLVGSFVMATSVAAASIPRQVHSKFLSEAQLNWWSKWRFSFWNT